MKILNFTAVEVLPSLLDKTKTQTIRSAWKLQKESIWELDKEDVVYHKIEKPARYKLGEKVKVVWNQRSEYQYFCNKCGKEVETKSVFHCCPFGWKMFNKLLGTAEITEVFKIEMDNYGIQRLDKPLWSITELAKLDGFKDYFEMKSWFDKKYDLSQVKEFWVYRWVWAKPTI